MSQQRQFGKADATLIALGGEAKVYELVEAFYTSMSSDSRYLAIWRLHQRDKAQAVDRLARFLIGWMGGPRRYSEAYGSLSIPGAHAHIFVDTESSQAWLACMSGALDEISCDDELKAYVLEQLKLPAQKIVELSAKTL